MNTADRYGNGLLAGKKIIVTVSQPGLVTGLCTALDRAGARVVLIGNQGLPQLDQDHCVVPTNDSAQAVHDAFLEAARVLDGIDLVIHSAAAPEALSFSSFDRLEHAQWQGSVDAVLKHTLYVLQASRLVFTTGKGAVLMIGPSVALTGARQLVSLCAAFEGQRALAKCAARQFGAHGITVNWLAISSEYFSAEFESARLPQSPELGPPPLPLGNAPTVEEVVTFIESLNLTNNTVVTGASICLDGGQWMMP